MPLEATQHTARGARAFAEFFIKTIDWGYATTSSAYMRHYFDPKSCVACGGFASAIDHVGQVGERYEGGRFSIKEKVIVSPPAMKHAERTVLVSVDVGRFRIVGAHGETVKHGPPLSNERFEISLTWRASAWIVLDLGAVA